MSDQNTERLTVGKVAGAIVCWIIIAVIVVAVWPTGQSEFDPLLIARDQGSKMLLASALGGSNPVESVRTTAEARELRVVMATMIVTSWFDNAQPANFDIPTQEGGLSDVATVREVKRIMIEALVMTAEDVDRGAVGNSD